MSDDEDDCEDIEQDDRQLKTFLVLSGIDNSIPDLSKKEEKEILSKPTSIYGIVICLGILVILVTVAYILYIVIRKLIG